ncbi:MAG: lipoprotein [Proteobacteria bacterium]|nr:lipoprotein [Pseudomonadota bacterium]
MRTSALILLVLACALLAACGSKGPLVLPDKSPQTQPAQPATTPAPAQNSDTQ